jgi:hypothetical protein
LSTRQNLLIALATLPTASLAHRYRAPLYGFTVTASSMS